MHRHTKTLQIRRKLYKEASKNWDQRYGQYFDYDKKLRYPTNHIFVSYKGFRWTNYVKENHNFHNFSKRYYKQEGVETKNWFRKFEPEWNHLDREKRRKQKRLDRIRDDLVDYLDNSSDTI